MNRKQLTPLAIAVVLVVALLLREHAHTKIAKNSVDGPEPSMMPNAPTAAPLARTAAESESKIGVPTNGAVTKLAAVPAASQPTNLAQMPTRIAEPIAAAVPSLEEQRREVEKNPHVTPLSLLRFSDAVQSRIEQQATTDQGAARVFTELEDCVAAPKDKDAHSVQALCLLNARRLSKAHPELAGRYASLRTRAQSEVLRRADAID
jgi:hypothetical protein